MDPRFESLWTSISQRTLRLAAERLNVPVQELAEEVLAREASEPASGAVPMALVEVEMELDRLYKAWTAELRRESERDRSRKLDSILSHLPSYTAENLATDVAELAHAEVTEEDPLSARRVIPEDVHGVGAAFGRRLEPRPR